MVSARVKVQEHLHNWRSEFRRYHQEEKGKIVEGHDHLMDATRYLVVSGRAYLKARPRPSRTEGPRFPQGPGSCELKG
jgi:hypothetical protein